MVSRFFSHIFLTFGVMIATLFCAFGAEEVSFTTSAPMMVSAGETFRVEFAVNASPDRDSFAPPQFGGFDVLAGPAVSQGSSIQIVNGNMTRTQNVSYTYVLVAQEAGNFTIGAASVVVDKKSYSTKPLPIEVVSEVASQRTQHSQYQPQSQRQSAQQTSSPEGRLAKDDILLRTIVSRKSLYKGEPLRATIKLYSRVGIAGADSEKMPSFNGFWAQEIPNSSQQTQRETYNGKVYETQVLRDYMLYPQQTGELTIASAQMDIIAQVIMPGRSIDPFFGSGHEVYNVRRHISTPEIKIESKALPASAPASFLGAVGSFDIVQTPPKTDLVVNSASTLTLRVEGVGNLSFVQALKVNFPESFESYNVKTTESINLTANGGSGYKQFEYPFIPRSQGEYTIPAVELSYFDPKSESYVVTRTQPMTINVIADESGASNSTGEGGTLQRALSREDVKMLGRDIRFIKINSGGFERLKTPFIFSAWYFGLLGLLLLLAIVVYVVVRGLIKESENIVLAKGKRANKVAVQRFKEAKRYMNDHNERAFYEEMLRCLWGYMSDKFNIPVANLTRESVREELHKRGVVAEDIKSFSDIISQCDEAQYSPLSAAQMGEVYGHALKLISNIETQVKR